MATSLVGLEERANASVKVEMVRVIRASRQRVFDAWTRPEMIRQWFTPGTMTVADAAMDARESGEWRLLMNGGCVEDEQTDAARNFGEWSLYESRSLRRAGVYVAESER
jgi:uncharacterized protein YndB with AHSA1/START domain